MLPRLALTPKNLANFVSNKPVMRQLVILPRGNIFTPDYYLYFKPFVLVKFGFTALL